MSKERKCPACMSGRRRERVLTAGIGLLLGLQTFAMTMLNPFVNLYGMTLAGRTAFLCSMALAVFGLTNAALQIVSGHLGDRFGRKPVLLGALALLAAGMMMGYFAESICGLIVARAVQGCTTISSLANCAFNVEVFNFVPLRVGAFAGPMLSAALLATGSETAMDIASAILALACLALATRLRRKTPAASPRPTTSLDAQPRRAR